MSIKQIRKIIQAIPIDPRRKRMMLIAASVLMVIFLIARPYLFPANEEKNQTANKTESVSVSGQSPANPTSQKAKSPADPTKGPAAKEPPVSGSPAGSPKKNSVPRNNTTPKDSTSRQKSSRGPPTDPTAEHGGQNPSENRENASRPDSTGKSDNSSDRGKDNPSNASFLKPIGKDRFRSPAGLVYGPGSRDGHRLKHVMKHAQDDMSKPVHGVFVGTERQILELIDDAFRKVQANHRSVSRTGSGSRVSYSVYYGRRIGYVGGQSGRRKNNPPAKTLVLVLEDDRIITAYPK